MKKLHFFLISALVHLAILTKAQIPQGTLKSRDKLNQNNPISINIVEERKSKPRQTTRAVTTTVTKKKKRKKQKVHLRKTALVKKTSKPKKNKKFLPQNKQTHTSHSPHNKTPTVYSHIETFNNKTSNNTSSPTGSHTHHKTGLTLPEIEKKVIPEYPYIARIRKYEGKVILKALVNKHGVVTEIKIIKSSGHKILDKAAVNALKQWRFRPAKIGSQSTESWIEIPIIFKLDKNSHL